MNRRLLPLAPIIALMSSCSDLGSVNFRYTVEVSTPDGLRSGSSVMNIHGYNIPVHENIDGGQKIYLTGDVPFVDLPNGITLFALVSGQSGNSGPLHTLIWSQRPLHSLGDPKTAISDLKARPVCKLVEPKKHPDLIYFSDINNRKSVKRLSSEELKNEFGGVYKIRRAYVCTTSDKPQKSIDKKIPWMDDVDQFDPVNTELANLRYGGRN
ncbi:hypothetical protein GVO57_13485 [Sphingomonas changnyeongensis]|uniref:Lipoprotein n=1 Tax=Sphingomonas changnyeongensis TaxID=2698679 RepID=A0A7Z2NXH1_9SPHN|nr:hypothetical protein [Sphingomonas changnyeongensis]QHL91623.1 hypothetical protein GVO57_13485 [Sphingomonas changnyeongensis]